LIKPFYEEKHSNLFFSINEKNDAVLWDFRTKKQLNVFSMKNQQSDASLVSFEIKEGFGNFISAFDDGIIQVIL